MSAPSGHTLPLLPEQETPRVSAAEKVIEVKGLVRKYGDVVAVSGLDFTVHRGECVGLLGPNGAGKTTTLTILEGLLEPTAGEVRLLGGTWEKDRERLRGRIGVQFQDVQFMERVRVGELFNLFRSFYDHGLDPEQLLQLVRLDMKRRSYASTLSGGQRQRLSLGLALISDPEILFLDEPTTGLDPQSRRTLWDVVEELKRKGRSIVLTTHYMDEAEFLCDRIVIVDRGRSIADGTPTQLMAAVQGEQMIELKMEPAPGPELFAAVPGVLDATVHGGMVHLSVRDIHRALPQVLDTVAAAGMTLSHLSTRRATLDDVFLRLTGRSVRENTP